MTQITNDEIKKIELNILDEFVNFCNKNNLKYYLVYGTLLGAVRHNGFIPWDDDIDIGMLRDDYNKMIKILKSKKDFITDHIKLKTPYSNNYQYPFSKIIDTRTFVREKTMKKKYTTSVWIDIFPIDYVPDNESKAMKFIYKIKKMRKYLFYSIEREYIAGNLLKKILGFFLIPIISVFYQIFNIKKLIDKKAQKYNSNKFKNIAFVINGDSEKTLFSTNQLEQAEYSFEGKKYTSFKNYELYLTKLYGKWKELPPESKRIAHSIEAYYND